MSVEEMKLVSLLSQGPDHSVAELAALWGDAPAVHRLLASLGTKEIL